MTLVTALSEEDLDVARGSVGDGKSRTAPIVRPEFWGFHPGTVAEEPQIPAGSLSMTVR